MKLELKRSGGGADFSVSMEDLEMATKLESEESAAFQTRINEAESKGYA